MRTEPESNTTVRDAIRGEIAASGGAISFATFMRIALYHPAGGYYRQERIRVGRGEGTDFFTATSMGEIFTRLVLSACQTLAAPRSLAEFTFVEVGAEPAGGILPPEHPFGAAQKISVGQPIAALPTPSIVFSNELFDAQPCHRLTFRDGAWRELGVAWSDGPVEILLPALSPEIHPHLHRLPASPVEGYHLDLPLAAVDLLRQIAAGDWQGLFIAFDYGKTWREMAEETPQGTVRAYHRHRLTNNLLSQPGEQDLTCHVCWDWLQDELERNSFSQIELLSQEAFFVKMAVPAIGEIIGANPGKFDPRRQTLQQLIYPGHMGQKFQILSARRGPSK